MTRPCWFTLPLMLAALMITVAPCRAEAPSPPHVGDNAPNFTLTDLDGRRFTLADHIGARHTRPIVIEWFNPDCPFVKESHLTGSLKGLGASLSTDGVVWIAINSSAPGKQGHGRATNQAGKKRYAITYPILFDADGTVGQRYGATRTPEMIVISPSGEIIYRGAIDNTKGGDPGDVPKVINYVVDALKALRRGAKVAVPWVKPFGCSVKY